MGYCDNIQLNHMGKRFHTPEQLCFDFHFHMVFLAILIPVFLVSVVVHRNDNVVRKFCRYYHHSRYKIVKEELPSDGSLLDVGCGSPSKGMEDGAFLDYVGRGEGLDIEHRNIKHKFTKGIITKLPFQDESFDVVTALEVLEHVEECYKAFVEVHRVLKPNGVFIMSTPNNNILFRVFWELWEHSSWGNKWEDKHVNAHTKDEWLVLIKRTEFFEVEKVRTLWGFNVLFKLRKRI